VDDYMLFGVHSPFTGAGDNLLQNTGITGRRRHFLGTPIITLFVPLLLPLSIVTPIHSNRSMLGAPQGSCPTSVRGGSTD
jgi:hypothetical protein